MHCIFQAEVHRTSCYTPSRKKYFYILEHTPLQGKKMKIKNRLCLSCAEFNFWESALLLLFLMHLKINNICYSFHLLKGCSQLTYPGKIF